MCRTRRDNSLGVLHSIRELLSRCGFVAAVPCGARVFSAAHPRVAASATLPALWRAHHHAVVLLHLSVQRGWLVGRWSVVCGGAHRSVAASRRQHGSSAACVAVIIHEAPDAWEKRQVMGAHEERFRLRRPDERILCRCGAVRRRLTVASARTAVSGACGFRHQLHLTLASLFLFTPDPVDFFSRASCVGCRCKRVRPAAELRPSAARGTVLDPKLIRCAALHV